MNRHGMTLIELLMVLMILGIMAGLSALSVAGSARAADPPRCQVRQREAVRWARPRPDSSAAAVPGCPRGPLYFFPDGRIVGSDPILLEEPRHARP